MSQPLKETKENKNMLEDNESDSDFQDNGE